MESCCPSFHPQFRWPEFPEAEIAFDLDKIRALDANSVRLFLNHAYFTDSETRELAQLRLIKLLDLCDERDIKAIVTLFDLRPAYRLSNWPWDARHVSEIVSLIGNHSALLGIDIKNEADLDFEHHGQANVEAWLMAMISTARYVNPNVKLTVGWSDYEAADILVKDIDFLSYHDYRPLDAIMERLDAVREKSLDKPVMITEIGTTRWSPFSTKKRGAKRQARRLKTQLSGLKDAEGIFIWALNDFDHVSRDVVGSRPWRRKQQQHYGLYDGTKKTLPAAKIFKEFNADQKAEHSASITPETKPNSDPDSN